MRVLNTSEALAFITSQPRTAKLATVRKDNRPHVAPVWVDVDEGEIVFTTWHSTVKAANLRHSPKVALCIDDDQPPYTFVIVEGEAIFDDELSHLQYWAERIAGRYMGPDLAAEYGRRNAVPGELLVRVRITKITARSGISEAENQSE